MALAMSAYLRPWMRLSKKICRVRSGKAAQRRFDMAQIIARFQRGLRLAAVAVRLRPAASLR